MAVSCVVTSLLLPGHEPFPAALPTLKDVPFISRGSKPIHQQADGHISTVVSGLFFVTARFVMD